MISFPGGEVMPKWNCCPVGFVFLDFVWQDEILDVAGKIYKAGMSLLVIDTENKFVSTGFAKEIARIAQGNGYYQQQCHTSYLFEANHWSFSNFTPGKYYYLPNASDAVISATTKDALSVLKSSWFWGIEALWLFRFCRLLILER